MVSGKYATGTVLASFTVVSSLMLLVGCSHGRGESSSTLSVLQLSPSSIVGIWGGEHIQMTVGVQGAVMKYDCGGGTIDSAILPDADGNFQSAGTFTPGGGAEPAGGRPPEAAFYSGTIIGESMKLTGRGIDPAVSLGTFDLTYGDKGQLSVPCY